MVWGHSVSNSKGKDLGFPSVQISTSPASVVCAHMHTSPAVYKSVNPDDDINLCCNASLQLKTVVIHNIINI